MIRALILAATLTVAGCDDGERLVAVLTGQPTPAQVQAEAAQPVAVAMFVAAVAAPEPLALIVPEPECVPVFRVVICEE